MPKTFARIRTSRSSWAPNVSRIWRNEYRKPSRKTCRRFSPFSLELAKVTEWGCREAAIRNKTSRFSHFLRSCVRVTFALSATVRDVWQSRAPNIRLVTAFFFFFFILRSSGFYQTDELLPVDKIRRCFHVLHATIEFLNDWISPSKAYLLLLSATSIWTYINVKSL